VIVKGKARSGAAQLAEYLMRSDEHATLLELHYGDGDLKKAFIDWDAMGELTRGEKTLYHAQIAPEGKYKMTPEQYRRAAQMLVEDLGMKGHPYAVVTHDGGDKPHAHVVICRTDPETLKMWDDSFNFVKHERASFRMEKEFGHDHIPGKHAKRDRKKQEEFPRAEATKDDYEQAARTELSLEERKAQVTAIRQKADDAQAFRNALEEAGYLLARGDRRGFVLVDGNGDIFSLSKHVTDIKGKAYKEFMAPLDPATLPDVDQAKAMQAARAQALIDIAQEKERAAEAVSKSDAPEQAQPEPQTVSKSDAPEEAITKGVEASKFLQPQEPEQAPKPELVHFDAEMEAHLKWVAEEIGRQFPRTKADQPAQPEAPEKAPERERSEPEPVDPERKQQIVALRVWSDGAQAFRHALEEAGYTLARGKTGYVVVSEDGVFNLARYAGLNRQAFDAFMSAIPQDSVPDVQAVIEAQKQAREQSKFFVIEPEAPQKPTPLTAKDTDLATRMEISALDMAAEAIAEAQKQATPQSDPELATLMKALDEREAAELRKWEEYHAHQLRQQENLIDLSMAEKLDIFKADQVAAVNALKDGMREDRSGVKGWWEAAENRLNPELGSARAEERKREIALFKRRQAKELKDYIVLLEQNKQLELEAVQAQQAVQKELAMARLRDERERYISEHEESRRILEEMERQRKELEKYETFREGPPPPKLGK
jgi:hypothetical protein